MDACCCPRGTSGRMTGSASTQTPTSSGPSTSTSPKPCRPRPHSKVPGQSLESHRGPVSHHVLFRGCSSRSAVTRVSQGGVERGPRWLYVAAVPLSSPVALCRPAVRRPWEVQRGEPVHQEAAGLIHHHPGLPALPRQVRPGCSMAGSFSVWSVHSAPGSSEFSGLLLKCPCPSGCCLLMLEGGHLTAG